MTSVVAINVLMVCYVDDSNGSFLQLGPTRFKGRKRIRQTPVACMFAPLDLGTFQHVGPQDPQIVVVRIPLLPHILPECALFLLNEFS